MQFYTKQHDYYCGIDLHTKVMYLCILNSQGDVVFHKNMNANPEALTKAIEPFRENLVIGVECMFTWYWVSDYCAKNNIRFVLGHALYMKAIHGGKAKNDKIDSYKIVSILRGGTFPMAYNYPSEMRATRDLLRRRMHLMRKRSELLSHIQNTNYQYNLPEFGKKITYKCNRHLLENHFPDPSAQRSVELDIEIVDAYDKELSKVEYFLKKNAKSHDYLSYMILKSFPGIGDILSLVILYEIDDIGRFKSVQRFSSYARLIKCRAESAGKTFGTSGAKIGNAYLKWAFSEAAILFMRYNPAAKVYVNKLSRKHGKGKAISILAAKIGRTVYFMLKRKSTFNADLFVLNV
ncbi:MAG: IS110 family transposase [Desulfobacterales bacterium]|nr:IS110 family transposase [Desulfobacterales bacterium]